MLPSGELLRNASFPTIDGSCIIVKTKQQNRKIKTVKCTKCSLYFIKLMFQIIRVYIYTEYTAKKKPISFDHAIYPLGVVFETTQCGITDCIL